MNKVWTDEAWDDYMYWFNQDKKTIKWINALIKDIDRATFDGIGKPEVLFYIQKSTTHIVSRAF